MRIKHLLALFVVIFLAFTIPMFLTTNLSAKSFQLNNNYSSCLLTATEGAIAAVAEGDNGAYIFANETDRQKAVNVFYETLIQCFNYDYSSHKELVKYYVPCIFMIDTDGYYVEYTIEYTATDGYAKYQEIITPINHWSKTYSLGSNGITGNIYTVEYHLDDNVVITYTDNRDTVKTISGNYADVYKKLGSPTELQDVFSTESDFNEEKKDVIMDTLSEQMAYYINVHDESNNQFNNQQYEFTLPEITGEDWARLIDSPTVVSFLQGMQAQTSTGFLNIYAFAGSEIEKNIIYYISENNGMKYYHRDWCTNLSAADMLQSYTMKQAAMNGAYPCNVCIK